MEIAWGPGADVFVHLDEVHQASNIAFWSFLERVRGIGTETMWVELFHLLKHVLCELIGRGKLATDFIAKSPNDDRRVIAVARNHLAHLLKAVLENVGVRLIGHAFERFPAPSWDFALNENAVTVAVVKDTTVLRPMGTCE